MTEKKSAVNDSSTDADTAALQRQSESGPSQGRGPYVSPTLKVFGTLLDLTHSGTKNAAEGAGPLRRKAS